MITSEEGARTFVAEYAGLQAMERLDHLVRALLAENREQNLIAKPSEAQIWQRHIADSVQLLRFVPRETWVDGGSTSSVWLDLGTGAGFPGLVIAAIAPKLPVYLVESRRRRVEWLERMAADMTLSECQILGKRLELVEAFDVSVISARAFAPLPKLLKLSSAFSTSSTRFLLPKGRSAAQELMKLPKSARKLFHVEHSLTDPDAGIIVSNNNSN